MDGGAQHIEGRRFRGIGGAIAVGLSQQVALEDGVDHMEMVEDAKGSVVRLGVLSRVQGGEGIQQLAVGPGLVAKEGWQGRVVHGLP